MRASPLVPSVLAWTVVAIGGPLAGRAAGPPSFQQVGLCYSGFGVPGSGRPYVFGSQVLVNAGEGYPTLCDVSDPRHPKVLRYLPTWFFTTYLYPLPSRDLVYLSNSRGPLLVLEGVREAARRGHIREIRWDSAWGRSFLSGLRADGIGYTVCRGAIFVLDLNDPDHPRQLARLEQPRLKAPTLSGEVADQRSSDTDLLSFSEDGYLAAAVLDGGRRVGLLQWLTPTEPCLSAEFDNVALTEGKATAYGRVLAMDRRRLLLGHPASTSPYWRCVRVSLYDVHDPQQPRRTAELSFDDPQTHLRDVILAGPHAFFVDGREIASGHTVMRTQHSRLLVVDLADLTHPTTVATYEDSMPTEYSRLVMADGKLYVNDYNFGLWIFDVRDPRKPVKLGGVPVSAEGHWLYLCGDYAYMGHTFGGTIHVIHVADPTKPKTVGYYWDGQWLNYQAKIRGSGHAMYLPQYDGLAIVDISRPAEPRRAGEVRDEHGRPLVQPCLDVAKNLAFVTASPSRQRGARLLVYDLADPLRPRRIGQAALPGTSGFRVLAAEQMLYLVAYGGKRIVAVDVTDPTHPKVTADLAASSVRIGGKTFSLAIQDGGGNGAPGLAFGQGYLYVTTGGEAPEKPYLLIFDVRQKHAIQPAGTLLVPDRQGWQYFACDVLIDGNRLYLGDYGCEEAYDLSDPVAPKRIAQYRRAYSWQVGAVRGKYLYVPKLDGLEILRVP